MTLEFTERALTVRLLLFLSYSLILTRFTMAKKLKVKGHFLKDLLLTFSLTLMEVMVHFCKGLICMLFLEVIKRPTKS